MEARIEQGYAVFQAPIGYRYKKTAGQGKMLFRDEPNASIIQEALEGYASGRFQSQAEVKRFLELHPSLPLNKSGHIAFQRVTDILERPVYAGYVEAPTWSVSLRLGRHEGLISFETFQKIQERIKGKTKAAARKDISADFPLRGFITCGDCNNPLTSCWSTSKTGKKHPYYMCFKKDCESHRKSIPRDKLEGEFEVLLGQLQPTDSLFHLAKAMFKDAWNMRLGQTASLMKGAQGKTVKLEKQIDNFWPHRDATISSRFLIH